MAKLEAVYDDGADVLYVTLDLPRLAYSDEGEDGRCYEYDDGTNEPCAVTIDGFRELWSGREADLSSRVAAFLGGEAAEVGMIMHAAVAAVSRQARAKGL